MSKSFHVILSFSDSVVLNSDPAPFCIFVKIFSFKEDVTLYLNNFELPTRKDDFYLFWDSTTFYN
jgi:hypothetical protein